MPAQEVYQVTRDLMKSPSRFDKFFPDWIPSCIASNICSVPHVEIGESVCFSSNNTAVHEVFDRVIAEWDDMFNPKAYLHVFEKEGVSAQDMMESRNMLQYISEQYAEYSRWEDKFFEEGVTADGKPVINDRAIDYEDQRKMLEEMQDLADGTMYLSQVSGGRGTG